MFVSFKERIGMMMAQIIWSGGRPVEFLLDVQRPRPLDSTGRPVVFYWMSTRILQVCFKCILELPISSKNVINISTGRPIKFPLEFH